jgi:hypothetical protein
MFAVRVVGSTEIVEDRYGLYQTVNSLEPESCDAGRHDRLATGQMPSKLVVEHAYAVLVRRHG